MCPCCRLSSLFKVLCPHNVTGVARVSNWPPPWVHTVRPMHGLRIDARTARISVAFGQPTISPHPSLRGRTFLCMLGECSLLFLPFHILSSSSKSLSKLVASRNHLHLYSKGRVPRRYVEVPNLRRPPTPTGRPRMGHTPALPPPVGPRPNGTQGVGSRSPVYYFSL